MDVKEFVDASLGALAQTGRFEGISWQEEGPIAKGLAHVPGDLFLRFYYNETTGTIAFALIRGQARVWGIDHDNLRGWHLHPVTDPADHVAIQPMSIQQIIHHLNQVLADLSAPTPEA